MSIKPSAPSLPKQLPAAEHLTMLEPAVKLENAQFERPVWSGQNSHRAQLDVVRLVEPDLASAVLKDGGWTDTEVSGGLLAGLNLTGSSLRRVGIMHARLSGAVLAEAELRDVIFVDAKLDLINFRHAKLSRVAFVRCHMVDADFGGAQLSDVAFESCDLTSADFSGARIKSTDLRSSTLQQIKGINGLAGAAISSDQMVALLPEFAAALGIVVTGD